MKKLAALLVTLAVVAGCVGIGLSMAAANNEQAEFTLSMQINNPQMSVNGEQVSIDDSGTTPVIVNERTLW